MRLVHGGCASFGQPVDHGLIGPLHFGYDILIAFALRAITLAGLWSAVVETCKTTAMLMMIVIGASVLNPFLAVTGIPSALGEGLNHMGVGPYGTLLLIIAIYVVLGMFLDSLSMLVVTIPIFFPIIKALGFDPIWFGVISVIVIEMGLITPPVGLNVFVVKGVMNDVPLATVFRGVFPFMLSMVVCLALIIVFPEIALMIPNSMFGN
ncbi:TRAP transporter large permease subunit [Thioclava sp. BHET1]|nr:TRAP transporter large permease subunit [Thioclava sp. BHET1]